MKVGHVFLCSRVTEQECLERELFGGMEGYEKKTGEVRAGDTLFLFNYQTKKIHGAFEAVSDGAMNIEPDAWETSGRSFPWQVRVKRVKEYKPISRQDYWHLLRFKKYPPARLDDEQVSIINSLLIQDERLPDSSDDFSYVTDDGHFVRSKGELEIDNWLYQHGIAHAYEPFLKELGVKRCDFYIPGGSKVTDGYFIEFWGLTDRRYQKDREEKTALYQEKELQLIGVEPNDLKKLDQILGDALL
ncbi:MAG: hypothetical protein AAGA35_01015 [Patescibacteria group bacterium]